MRWIRKDEVTGVMAEFSGLERRLDWYPKQGLIGYPGKRPLSQLDIVDGVVVELAAPEPDTSHDWQDKELFIEALYSLISVDQIAAVMADSTSLKDAIAGMALLTTKAAPDGLIDIADARVAQWLSLAGVTVAQVKAQMTAPAEVADATP